MMYLAGMAFCALLFVLFGVARPRTECNGRGCGGCSGVCHRRDEFGDTHP